jgi:hypothetical protein
MAEQGAKRGAQTIESIPLPEGVAAVQNSAPSQRLNVTAWILGSARVASLLASPVDDEVQALSPISNAGDDRAYAFGQ